ncbi:MAG: hypothetical protein ACP5NF_06190 [Thermoanaerobaculum sp.]
MLSVLAFSVAVAVAQGSQVVLVALPEGRELGRWQLPAHPSGLFASPDGALWAPLAGDAGTAVLVPGQTPKFLEGRLVPLFFREADRLFAVCPGELRLLSNPERAEIARFPLPAGLDVRFAVASHDGRVVALLAGRANPELILVFPFDGGQNVQVRLPSSMVSGTVALGTSLVAVGAGRSLWLAPVGSPQGVSLELPGETVALAWGREERELFLLVSAPQAHLLRVKVPAKLARLKPPSLVWQASGRPRGMVASDEGQVVLDDQGVSLVSPKGKLLGSVPLAGGTALAVLPQRPQAESVPWSDTANP